MEIITIDNTNFECYEYLEEYYIGADEINRDIQFLRHYLAKLDEEIGLKDIKYRLIVYEYQGIDAFVKKNNLEYILGISIGAFTELKKWFNMFFSNEKIYEIWELIKENREFYIKYTYQKALEFLISHEYAHLKNGHCDIPENEERLIFEKLENASRENTIFCQGLEFDADNWAIANCVVKILEENISYEEMKEKLELLIFSVYSIFKKFSEYDNYRFDAFMKDDLLKCDHPEAWIRFRYVFATMLTNIHDSSLEYKDILDKDLVSVIMKFESEVLELKSVKEKMYGGAHTKKATEHLILLYNTWNKIADILEKYTHDELIRVELSDIDPDEISFVDENGNMILG